MPAHILAHLFAHTSNHTSTANKRAKILLPAILLIIRLRIYFKFIRLIINEPLIIRLLCVTTWGKLDFCFLRTVFIRAVGKRTSMFYELWVIRLLFFTNCISLTVGNLYYDRYVLK